MPNRIRSVLARAIAGSMLALLPAIGQAADTASKYPQRPIRLVASTTAGSQPDTIARMLTQKMSEALGAGIVVDNRPGGGGILAGNVVARAAADGYTLQYVLPNFVITPAMQGALPYDPAKDFAAIAQIGLSTNVLVASAALGAKSIPELVEAAKAQPGKLIFATSPAGSATHLSGVRFNLLSGIKVVHVAFKGGPDATIELLAGRAHYHLGTMGVVLPFVKEGKLVALGVTTPQRSSVLPNVPALGELYAEFRRPETSHGLVAPAGTPRPILNQIAAELRRALELHDVKEKLQSIAFVTAWSPPEEYGTTLRAQLEGMSRVVRDAGLRGK